MNTTTPKDQFAIFIKFFPMLYLGLLLALGIFGNVYCIVAYTTSDLRKYISTRYLTALSTSDLGFVLCMALTWIKSFGLSWLDFSIVCQTTTYLSNVCCFLSGWYVAALSAERCLAVCWPYVARRVRTTSRTTGLIFIIAVFGAILNSPLLYLAKPIAVEQPEGAQGNWSVVLYACDRDPDAATAYQAFTTVDTVVSFTMPMLITFILNSVIACRLCQAAHERRTLMSHQFTPSSEYLVKKSTLTPQYSPVGVDRRASRQQSDQSNLSNLSLNASQRRRDSYVSRHGRRNATTVQLDQISNRSRSTSFGSTRRKNTLESRITYMLAAKSMAYLLLNLPSYLHRVITAFTGNENDAPTESQNLIELVAYLLFYTQFSTNFLLYSLNACVSGFGRREAKRKPLLMRTGK